MDILLLGGTGVIGNYLCNIYRTIEEVNVVITSRKNHTSNGAISYIKGNAMDNAFLKDVCNQRHWDVIVDFMSYKTAEFKERISILLSSSKQYLFISSARVYGNKEHPIKETSPRLLDCSDDYIFLQTDEYSLTKARQEDLLFSSGYKNYTIIRPCITYGIERMQLGVMEKEEWLYRAMHGRTIVICNEIMSAITTMTNGMDIANAMIQIIGNPQSYEQVYHLTSSHHRTWKQVFEIYSKAFSDITGYPIKLKVVTLDEFLHCRLEYLKYQVIYDRVYDRNYDVSKISTLIDVTKFVSPEIALSDCIKKFIKSKYPFKNINWVMEARKDRLTGEFTSLSEIKGLKNKFKYLVNRFFTH